MADKQEKLQQLMELKSFYEQGFMSKEEFDKRRIEIIDGGTGTKAKVAVMAGESASPQVKKDKNPVYADRHFDRTQADSLKDGEYVVVAPPTATNKHLYTGAAADSPFSYVTTPVPIDPNRGKAEVTNAKRMDNTTVIYAHTHAGGADRDQQVAKLEEDKKKLSWELFYAASVNDVPRIKELLDRGAEINQRDFDTEATPIIVAGARGQKHAVYYMVERGAEVNAQNARGETVLHEAVKLKFNEMALWLVKHGADIHLENFRGYSGYDLALPWLQKELKDERDHYLREQKKKVKAAMPAPEPVYAPDPAGGVATIRREPKAPNHDELAAIIKKTHETDTNTGAYVEKYGAPVTKVVVRSMEGAPLDTSMRAPVVEQKPAGVQEVLKIYLKNGSYKCIVVTSDHTAKDLADSMAEKINMSKYANYFDIIEVVRGQEKRLDPAVNILASRKKWPLILGPTGNETELNCRFVVVPKRGTPDNITMMYRDAIYGGAK